MIHREHVSKIKLGATIQRGCVAPNFSVCRKPDGQNVDTAYTAAALSSAGVDDAGQFLPASGADPLL